MHEFLSNFIKERVEVDYVDRDGFAKACNIYLHQTVFDKVLKKLVYLSPISENDSYSELLNHLGPQMDNFKANKIVEGEASPTNGEEYFSVFSLFGFWVGFEEI